MFYRRFEHLLTLVGLTRHPAETQREYARRSAEFLIAQFALVPRTDTSSIATPQITRDRLAAIPPRIAEAYYQVRFGQLPLQIDTEHHLNDALRVLETMAAVCKKRNRIKKD